jgi:hypothetical protein
MDALFHNSETLFLIGGAVVMIVLIALTMRSIIRRDRAMVNKQMDEPREVAEYHDRWKGQKPA